MVKFIEVDPNEIEDVAYRRRGRVSYPILKGFLETGMYVAKLDLTGVQQSKQGLSSSLNSYIRSHRLPIKLFMRQGAFYLMRLDIDAAGNRVEDWEIRGIEDAIAGSAEATEITPIEVQKRFETEKGQTTK